MRFEATGHLISFSSCSGDWRILRLAILLGSGKPESPMVQGRDQDRVPAQVVALLRKDREELAPGPPLLRSLV